VVKFNHFKDREYIRKSSHKLAGTRIGISEQYPREIPERRKLLIPVMKNAQRDGSRAVLSADKLFIDGRLYKQEEHRRIVRDEGGRPVIEDNRIGRRDDEGGSRRPDNQRGGTRGRGRER
jgi:hypothetical protein